MCFQPNIFITINIKGYRNRTVLQGLKYYAIMTMIIIISSIVIIIIIIIIIIIFNYIFSYIINK